MEINTLMVPRQARRTGISKGLLEDLTLKTLYLRGEMNLVELSDVICLSLEVIEEIFQFLRKEQLCEVKGMSGGISYRIAASATGRKRAEQLFTVNQYAGPAPVSLSDYTGRVRSQSAQDTVLQPADVRRAFHELVLDGDMIKRLGTSIASGTSLFLHGPSGTGKTTMAGKIPEVYTDFVWIPHAVEVDNQIIKVFDPGVHRQPQDAVPEDTDRRWVLCRRPCVLAGGELSADMLDLQFNEATNTYTAPLQMKANNGVLIIDDFGRQKLGADELLNRWMTPLDRRIDFLTLQGAKKFEIPFNVFVAFSTNLDPAHCADEAFLRRIPNKIRVDYATPEQFAEIFRRECQSRSLRYDPAAAEYAAHCILEAWKRPLAQCYARDLINQILWEACYSGVEAIVNHESINQACHAYFLSTAKS
jgi:predicted ATPase with chaperone activity